VKYIVNTTYTADSDNEIDFPEGRTWSDVAEWYVKWHTLYLRYTDTEAWSEIDLGEIGGEVIDIKRPSTVSIFLANDDGSYGDELTNTE